MIHERAPAKVNLFLHVGDKRQDGFHPLQSLAVFTDLGDALEIAPAAALTLAINGPFAAGLEAEGDNLVLRAARALGDGGAALTLSKNLPVASGIGGGSADAAAALRGLAKMWSLEADLHGIGAGLGSDIPVCLDAIPAFMESRGEILRPLVSLPRLAMLLVNPGAALPTRDVFAALSQRSGVAGTLPRGRFRDTADLLRFLETTRNDLEAAAQALQPVIGEVLAAIAALPGALFTRMSGSGATCFGIFADDDCCARAEAILKQASPRWWVSATFVPETGIEHDDAGQDIGPTEAGL